MRIYSASSEETLRARKLLKDWAGEGFLTEAQYQRLEQETVSDLRTTNIFLRLVLFLFTLIIVGAAAGAVLRGFSFAAIGANHRHFLPDLRCRLLRGRRSRRFPSPALSLRDRGSARRLLGWFSLRGNAGRSFQRQSLFAEAGRNPVPGSRRRRHLFALDMASLRALVCISRRDDLRSSFCPATGPRPTRRSM